MKCSRIQEKLLLLNEHALPGDVAVEIRRHLRSCVCCSAVASELREIEKIAGSAVSTTVSAPAGFDARVMTAIREGCPPLVRYRLPMPLPSRLRRMAIAALLLIVAVTAVAIGHWSAYKGMEDRLESLPAPSSCGQTSMIPSIHALPRINGRVVAPNSPELLRAGNPPSGVYAQGHMRKHGPLCRCWAIPVLRPTVPSPNAREK